MKTSLKIASAAALLTACTAQSPNLTTTSSALTAGTSSSIVQTPLAPGAAAVAGTVTPTSGCGGTSTQVILYSSGSPLYQTSAPPYGTFQIQANPGTYVLVAEAANGCGVTQNLTLTAGQTSSVTLNLVPGGASTATNTGTTIPSCYYSYYGCAGMYYPGYGDIALGKPNIYLTGQPGTEVKVGLDFGTESNLLVATPALGASASWDVKLGSDGKQLVAGAATYNYLYYDLRTVSAKFTDRLAFCVQSGDLEPTLEKYLESMGFQPNEVADFGAFWSNRFPSAESYCVYPQESDVADAAVPLHVTPAPIRSTRVWFLVVPQKPPKGGSGGGTELARFLKPKASSPRDTLFAQISARHASRGLASAGSSDGLVLREWGVALVFE